MAGKIVRSPALKDIIGMHLYSSNVPTGLNFCLAHESLARLLRQMSRLLVRYRLYLNANGHIPDSFDQIGVLSAVILDYLA
jgi:hypothetical protein